MTLPTSMDLVPGAACTSVLLLFPSPFSMSEAVDIVTDLEPARSDSSSCNETNLKYSNITDIYSKTGDTIKYCKNDKDHMWATKITTAKQQHNNTVDDLTG